MDAKSPLKQYLLKKAQEADPINMDKEIGRYIKAREAYTSESKGGVFRRAINSLVVFFVRRSELEELIQHCWIHSGYTNCGYKHMTTKQKKLYDRIVSVPCE